MANSPEDKNALLVEQRSRASRLKVFVEGEFWLKDIKPYLLDELERSGMTRFKPVQHAASVEQIALQFAFNSGMAGQIDRLLEQMSIWTMQGQEALVKLKEIEEAVK